MDNINDSKLEEVEKDFDDLVNLLKHTEVKEFNPIEHKDRTRAHIALGFVGGYFLLLILIPFFTYFYNVNIFTKLNSSDHFINPKDMFLAVGTLIGSPLGFVLGYYFKSGDTTDT